MTDPAPRALPAGLARWRETYWDRPVSREVCAAMVAKYDALAALEILQPGKEQDAALRAAASRWPGCLRESQLAGPERCQARRAQAAAGLSRAPQPRAAWRAAGAEAVVLWADLHLLLADLLAWRQATGGRDGAAGLVAFTAGNARWPADAQLLSAVAGTRMRPRAAYLWLAAQAGMPLAALNLALFGRSGPWDLRAGDPPALL